MRFHIMTLFPDMVLNGLNTSIIGRAAEKGIYLPECDGGEFGCVEKG